MIRCIYIKKSKMHYRSLNFSWYVILVYELSKYVIVISKLSLGLWSTRKWFYNIELLLNIYNWNPIYFVNWFFILPLLDRFNLPRFISPGVVPWRRGPSTLRVTDSSTMNLRGGRR
jgi:hypothetical protein